MISAKIRQILSVVVGTFCLLLMLTVMDVFVLNKAEAQAAIANCPQVPGTYLLNTYYGTAISSNNFTGKRVISLTSDGQIVAIDSNQGGTYGVPPAAQGFPNNRFTSGRGVWECGANDNWVEATTLNFNFPDPNSAKPEKVTVAKSDYYAKFNFSLDTVSGTFTITSFPLDGDLPEQESSHSYTFAFDGTRISTP
ncbi:hypothetical protein [Gloeothece verrucosa]|uniref:Uncharacterized protein n=1 Tax=Gloeothece verrucosa (strain PCC 7822) TaxID=497965 RepID=E0UE74_GLOV7|nr:hypothetical protein [Gloeothece verrucosa]ADN14199.1 hypothetical protein Cyan7822_2220 [Gloeothece verrucosa PCC 7822]